MKMRRLCLLALTVSAMASGSVLAQNQEEQQGVLLLRATPEARSSFYDPLKFTFGDFQQAFNSGDPLISNSARVYLMAVMDLAESKGLMCSPYKVKPTELVGSLDFDIKKVHQSRYRERAGVVLLDILNKINCEKRS